MVQMARGEGPGLMRFQVVLMMSVLFSREISRDMSRPVFSSSGHVMVVEVGVVSVRVAGVASNPTGGSQVSRELKCAQSFSGAGQTFSPPKFCHLVPFGSAGWLRSSGAFQRTPGFPMRPNCMMRLISGTMVTSAVSERRMIFSHSATVGMVVRRNEKMSSMRISM